MGQTKGLYNAVSLFSIALQEALSCPGPLMATLQTEHMVEHQQHVPPTGCVTNTTHSGGDPRPGRPSMQCKISLLHQ